MGDWCGSVFLYSFKEIVQSPKNTVESNWKLHKPLLKIPKGGDSVWAIIILSLCLSILFSLDIFLDLLGRSHLSLEVVEKKLYEPLRPSHILESRKETENVKE